MTRLQDSLSVLTLRTLPFPKWGTAESGISVHRNTQLSWLDFAALRRGWRVATCGGASEGQHCTIRGQAFVGMASAGLLAALSLRALSQPEQRQWPRGVSHQLAATSVSCIAFSPECRDYDHAFASPGFSMRSPPVP